LGQVLNNQGDKIDSSAAALPEIGYQELRTKAKLMHGLDEA
jgi:hypothetical protein